MATSVNMAILVGMAGSDPERRYSNNGTSILNFSLATDNNWQDKTTREWKKQTTWHKITAFAKVADACADSIHKGCRVYVQGEILQEEFETKAGVKVSRSFIRASRIVTLEKRADRERTIEPDVGFADDQIPY